VIDDSIDPNLEFGASGDFTMTDPAALAPVNDIVTDPTVYDTSSDPNALVFPPDAAANTVDGLYLPPLPVATGTSNETFTDPTTGVITDSSGNITGYDGDVLGIIGATADTQNGDHNSGANGGQTSGSSGVAAAVGTGIGAAIAGFFRNAIAPPKPTTWQVTPAGAGGIDLIPLSAAAGAKKPSSTLLRLGIVALALYAIAKGGN